MNKRSKRESGPLASCPCQFDDELDDDVIVLGMPWQRGHTLSIFLAQWLSQRNQGSWGALTQLASLPRPPARPSPSLLAALLWQSVTIWLRRSLCLNVLCFPSPAHRDIFIHLHSLVTSLSSSSHSLHLSLCLPWSSHCLTPFCLVVVDLHMRCEDSQKEMYLYEQVCLCVCLRVCSQKDQKGESRSAARKIYIRLASDY